MQFVLVDSKDNILSEISDKTFRTAPVKLNPDSDFLKRFEQWGSEDRSDGRMSVRKLEFKFDKIYNFDKDYRFFFNRLGSFFYKANAPYYIEDIDNNIRTRVTLDQLSPSFKEGDENRICLGCTLGFNLTDVLWEESIPSETDWIEMENDAETLVFLPDESIESKPVISLEAEGDNPDFAIDNIDALGTIRIQAAEFSNQTSENRFIEIDSVFGNLKVGGSKFPDSPVTFRKDNRIRTGGNFLTLIPGTNTIRYQSANLSPVKMKFKYRVRTLF